MELQTTFYILGIIFMAVMLILLIALVIAVFVIRGKIVAIEKQIQDKIDQVANIADRGTEIAAAVGAKAVETAAHAVKGMLDGRGKKKR